MAHPMALLAVVDWCIYVSVTAYKWSSWCQYLLNFHMSFCYGYTGYPTAWYYPARCRLRPDIEQRQTPDIRPNIRFLARYLDQDNKKSYMQWPGVLVYGSRFLKTSYQTKYSVYSLFRSRISVIKLLLVIRVQLLKTRYMDFKSVSGTVPYF